MADQWFFAQAGVTHGPYSAGQLKEEAAQGRLLPQDTVWKEGVDKKVLASRVQHLFSAPAAPLPAPPARVAVNPAMPPAVEAAPRSDPLPDDPGLLPLEAPAPAATLQVPDQPKAPPRRQEPPKKRVLHIKGGLLSSQDGAIMKFRKQCLKCSYLDTSMTTMPIPNGCARPSFYCPKCRKSQQLEIQGLG